jgi:cell division transport system permease protein
MKPWLQQHMQALKLVLNRMQHNLLSTLLIGMVIGVTLAIPSLLFVVIDNVSHLATGIKKESNLSLFLRQDLEPAGVETIRQHLKDHADVQQFTFVPKEEALQKLVAASNHHELTAALDTNPLPDAFLVEPKVVSTEAIETLKTALQNIEGVDEVVVDAAWLKRLNSVLKLGSKALFILACLLGFALVAVIANTIRMQILTQKAEIEVSQLFGATASFIRRPFLYTGLIYGILGGIFAMFILSFVVWLFNQSVTEIAANYQADFALRFQPIILLLKLITVSAIIGWLAAFLAVNLKPNTK